MSGPPMAGPLSGPPSQFPPSPSARGPRPRGPRGPMAMGPRGLMSPRGPRMRGPRPIGPRAGLSPRGPRPWTDGKKRAFYLFLLHIVLGGSATKNFIFTRAKCTSRGQRGFANHKRAFQCWLGILFACLVKLAYKRFDVGRTICSQIRLLCTQNNHLPLSILLPCWERKKIIWPRSKIACSLAKEPQSSVLATTLTSQHPYANSGGAEFFSFGSFTHLQVINNPACASAVLAQSPGLANILCH